MPDQYIVIVEGPNAGIRVPVDGELTIGRHPDNGLVIDSDGISRHHAVLRQHDGHTVVHDLGAVNGIVVNSRRVYEFKLYSSDVIHLGNVVLRFEDEVADRKAAERDKGVSFDYLSGSPVMSAAPLKDISDTFLNNSGKSNNPDELKDAQKRLIALYRANQIFSEERDLDKLLSKMMDQLFDLFSAHNGVIMLRDQRTDKLLTECVRSCSKGKDVVISTTIVEEAANNRQSILTNDAAADERFESTESIIGHNISSAMCVPLTYSDQVLGIIYLDTRGLLSAFDEHDLELLSAFAGPAGVAIKNASYLEQLESSYRETLTVLANAIELRDHYTAGHTWRVTNFALAIARELGWSESKLKELEMGGVVHDVGKISVDNAILSKPGKLTDEEYDMMKVHPERGAWMMRGASFLEPLVPYCLYHHEHYDGTGYPFGLKGENIPIEGRVIAVADALDAMTSNRPYSTGMSIDDAVRKISESSGRHFDPDCVDALLYCYKEEKLQHILQNYMKNDQSIVCPFCSTSIKPPDSDHEHFECVVCHRKVKVTYRGNRMMGELVE